MTLMSLAGGYQTIVDEEDFPLLSGHRWVSFETRGIRYVTDGRRPPLYLHRFLMGPGPDEEVDHRDGDGLNNQRSNLRVTTHRLNLANQRPQVGRSSRFKGVSFYKRYTKWEAYIKVDQRKRRLGYFSDEAEAARAYDVAATEAWGEFARTNF